MDDNCYYCGEVATGRARHTEHLIPRSKGGRHVGSNLVIACNICNSIKGDRTIEQMRPRLVQKMIGWPKFTVEQLAWLRAQGFDMTQFDEAKLWHERTR